MVAEFFVHMALIPASAPPTSSLGGGESIDLPVGRLVFGLILSITLAWGAALLVRRAQRGSSRSGLSFWKLSDRTGQRVRILETRRAAQNAEICLVACDEREYLIAFCNGHAVILRESTALSSGQDEAEHA